MHQVYIHNFCALSLPGLLLDRLFVFLAVNHWLSHSGVYLSWARLRGTRIGIVDKCAAFCARVPHCDLKPALNTVHALQRRGSLIQDLQYPKNRALMERRRGGGLAQVGLSFRATDVNKELSLSLKGQEETVIPYLLERVPWHFPLFVMALFTIFAPQHSAYLEAVLIV